MPKPNPHRPFAPSSDQMALAPQISGNTINGLGETTKRNPSIVYWATNPDTIAHGEMQKWFYTVDPCHPDFAKERAKRAKILNAPLPTKGPIPAELKPEEWLKQLGKFVSKGVCDKVGVANMNQLWAFEGEQITHNKVVVLGVQHDYNRIAQAPTPEAGAEVMVQYNRAAFAAKAVAGLLQELGWEAIPVTGPMASKFAMIPAAIEAGFGELGKHGSIINPEFGSSFRLSAVLTDAPIATTPKQDHGVDAFCQACRICEDACPPFAISSEKQMVRGNKKWYVDFDKCLPFFNEHQGCAICIAVCPWSRPGVGLNLAEKLAKRAGRLELDGS